jgi:hypothetical protein
MMNVSMRLTVDGLVRALRGQAHAIVDQLTKAPPGSSPSTAAPRPLAPATPAVHARADSVPVEPAAKPAFRATGQEART